MRQTGAGNPPLNTIIIVPISVLMRARMRRIPIVTRKSHAIIRSARRIAIIISVMNGFFIVGHSTEALQRAFALQNRQIDDMLGGGLIGTLRSALDVFDDRWPTIFQYTVGRAVIVARINAAMISARFWYTTQISFRLHWARVRGIIHNFINVIVGVITNREKEAADFEKTNYYRERFARTGVSIFRANAEAEGVPMMRISRVGIVALMRTLAYPSNKT